MKNLFVIVFGLAPLCQLAQTVVHCGSDVAMRKYYMAHPEKEPRNKPFDLSKVRAQQQSINSSFTIPMVVHVLHLGGQENISDAQVKDAIKILNMDFAKRNADTANIIPEFRTIADSTKIQFALATKDPNGNCTNGIVHYYDTDANWNDASPTIFQHTWNPTKYINVYIVKSITLGNGFSAAGYTYFPGTFAPGDQMDAIVVLNNYFGSIGTGNYFLSRVLTHEVGHWLGLAHVFGYNNSAAVNCFGDDFISDTPVTQGFLSCPDAADPSSYQICNPGISENYQNYMDYSYCVKMFTQEQALNMQYTLLSSTSGRDNLNTTANLISTGVINPLTPCIPIADFKYNRTETCIGVPVTFYDASNNSQATSFNWSFPGGFPATSTFSTPSVIYNLPGVYSVNYTSSTSAGSSSPISKTNIITVITGTATYLSNFTEGFETASLPNNDWDITNSSGGSNWEQSYDASYSGSFSAKLPSLNNTRLAVTSMISPLIDLTAISSPKLFFKLAASEVNPNHINNLKVLASTDCEMTWTQIYSKTGSVLVTTNSNTNPFYPSLPDWRSETINLSSVAGSSQVKFKFMYSRDTIPGAMNVYIDDINISGISGINLPEAAMAFCIYPNPATELININFGNLTVYEITVSDVLGKIVETIGEKDINKEINTIAVGKNTKFKPGMYFISLQSDDFKITRKIIIN